MKAKLQRIQDAAARFRQACEATSELISVSISHFPRGACGDAAVLIGQYVEDCGFGTWTYVSGDNRHTSHGWAERDGVIVDITADQFGPDLPPVIVTTDRAWHVQFERIAGSGHLANLAGWDGPAKAGLRRDYSKLRAAADAL